MRKVIQRPTDAFLRRLFFLRFPHHFFPAFPTIFSLILPCSAPNITVEADLLYTEADVTLVQIATALVNLDATGNFKVGSSVYEVNEPYLEPNSNAALCESDIFVFCITSENCICFVFSFRKFVLSNLSQV